MPTTSRHCRPDTHCLNSSTRPHTQAAPTRAPIEDPHTTSGWIPCFASAWITPICDQPRAAPLPSARPTMGAPFLRGMGGFSNIDGTKLSMVLRSDFGREQRRACAAKAAPKASSASLNQSSVQIVHIAIGNAHTGELSDLQMLSAGNHDKTVDLRGVGTGTSDRTVFVDLINKNIHLAIDPALQALGGNIILERHQAHAAL